MSRGVPYRRLLALARPEWRRILVGTIFLLLASAMSLAYPQAVRMIVDGALAKDKGSGPGAGSSVIDNAALGMIVIFALQAVAIALRYVMFTLAGERVVARLRRTLYEHVLAQEIAFFDERRTGELGSRLASDTTVLQNTVSVNVSMLLRNGASVIGGVGLLFYTSPVLTLIMLSVVPAVALGAVIYGKRIRRLSKQAQDALGDAGNVAAEAIAGIRTVRSFTAEPLEGERYGAAIERTFQLARQRAVAGATFMGAATLAAYGAIALVLWYGGKLVMRDAMSVGQLTSFVLYTLIVAVGLGAMGELWTDFMRASGAAERVFELLDREPTIALTGGVVPASVTGRVTLEKVEFSYPARPDVPVLRGVDLVVAPGEVVALVGPSGAGKSTVAALLGRLYDPQQGRVLLDGRDVRELDPTWLRKQIGVVAQEPILLSGTIEENVRYGRADASDDEVRAALRAANAHDFVWAFPEGHKTRVGERGVQLSGGQKQRVAIARALLKDPRILVLDEATSALDAESEHLVQQALDRLMKGRTTLVIAHRLSTVMHADRVVVVEGGQIVQSGRHGELMATEGLYRRLVERQFVSA
ncbi:MAG: ATP-binding cassette domain-containing protein [Deltaproteobacteria bacterium]|nr:ATP-binding cassette domain-containing protein [Deltaproteobacteria bacterium]